MTNGTYDIAIIGAGLGGSLVGTILARQGAKVLIIESGSHPRFVIGESTVRHVFRMMKCIAERYQVPELIEQFSNAKDVHKYITSACGEKRNFGFVYHREGQPQNTQEACQLVIPPFREGYEAHLFRQDIDSWLTNVAITYGATVKFKCMITDVNINQDGVVLTSKGGETFRARYVMDQSGYKSLLASKFQLRDNPPRARVNSRTIFTHMINMPSYDKAKDARSVYGFPMGWGEGTCHHIFKGGWFWIIPFHNREGSTNPLTSVGLSLDLQQWPKPANMTGEEEVYWFLKKFPSIAPQFEGAKAVRDWVSTDRLQFTSKRTIGYRYCLGPHAAAFTDAYFSRGLPTLVEHTNAFCALVLKAFKDNDFSEERFEYLERLQNNNLEWNDRLVNAAYISFDDFDLWNSWFRIWAIGVGLGDLRLAAIYRRYKATHDDSVLPDAEEPMGLFFSHHLGFKAMFEAAEAKLLAYRAGQMSIPEVKREIFKLVADCDFTPPVNQLHNPDRHWVNAGSKEAVIKSLWWLATAAPPDIKAMSGGLAADMNPKRLFSRKRAEHPMMEKEEKEKAATAQV
jgi:tetracycline 7-halogenase / FADH2 O2-dependent halogenase